MDKTKCSVAENVPAALDLIVAKAGGIKSRIENVHCIAIDARRDSMEPDTTQGGTAGLHVLRHIVRELDTFVDEIRTLVVELLETLRKTQPPDDLR